MRRSSCIWSSAVGGGGGRGGGGSRGIASSSGGAAAGAGSGATPSSRVSASARAFARISAARRVASGAGISLCSMLPAVSSSRGVSSGPSGGSGFISGIGDSISCSTGDSLGLCGRPGGRALLRFRRDAEHSAKEACQGIRQGSPAPGLLRWRVFRCAPSLPAFSPRWVLRLHITSP